MEGDGDALWTVPRKLYRDLDEARDFDLVGQPYTVRMGRKDADEYYQRLEQVEARARAAGMGSSAIFENRATVSRFPDELEHVKAALIANKDVDSVITGRNLKQLITQQLRKAICASMRIADRRMCHASISTEAGRGSVSAPIMGAQDTQCSNVITPKWTRTVNVENVAKKDKANGSAPSHGSATCWAAMGDETGR